MTIQIMPGIRQIDLKHRNKGRKKAPDIITLSPLPVPGQKDALYKSALMLVEWIDNSLAAGRIHFRRSNGDLLTTLDEVVRAVEAGEWGG